MGTFDQQTKKVLQDHALDIIVVSVPGITNLVPWSGEIAAAPQRIMDRVFSATFHEIEVFVHLEIQLQADPTIAARLFEYGSRLCTSHDDRPVISIVLWLEYHANIPDPPYVLNAGTLPVATWHYHNLKIYDLTKDQLRDAGVGLLILAPLARDVSIDDLEGLATQLKAKTEPMDLEEIGLLFATFAARRFKTQRDTVQTVLRKVGFHMDAIDQVIAESPWGQDFAERVAHEASAKAIIDAILTLWRGRFGEPGDDVKAAIEAADDKTLHTVLLNWSNDATLDAVRARIGL